MKARGKTHPVQDLIQKTRKVFITQGFDEIENQIFLPEDDVYKQYGKEAPIILDRCYYLAGLPRPDIGLSRKQKDEIEGIKSGFDFDSFTQILREYREGAVEGDDLSEEMVKRLDLDMTESLQIIDLIPEFKSVTPVPSSVTLRSHMTGAWFPTLAALKDSSDLPLKLFSIGLRFRREQKVDSTHLRVHYGASCVIMDDDFDLEEGKELSAQILEKLKFGNVSFDKKKATSNYYENDSEYELFSDGIEIADCGMYSPEALANYGIKHKVFNLGFGLERMLMVKNNAEDIRHIMYPQFYKPLDLSDADIAERVRIRTKPSTPEGEKLVGLLKKYAEKYADEPSPCSFPVYGGVFLGRDVKISLVERESDTKLLGPAALNEIYVYDGSIYGIPRDPGSLSEKLVEAKEKGIPTGISYLDSVLSLFSAEIEKLALEGGREGFLQVKMAKTPADVNIEVGDVARRFIMSNNRIISVKGPVFMALEATLE